MPPPQGDSCEPRREGAGCHAPRAGDLQPVRRSSCRHVYKRPRRWSPSRWSRSLYNHSHAISKRRAPQRGAVDPGSQGDRASKRPRRSCELTRKRQRNFAKLRAKELLRRFPSGSAGRIAGWRVKKRPGCRNDLGDDRNRGTDQKKRIEPKNRSEEDLVDLQQS